MPHTLQPAETICLHPTAWQAAAGEVSSPGRQAAEQHPGKSRRALLKHGSIIGIGIQLRQRFSKKRYGPCPTRRIGPAANDLFKSFEQPALSAMPIRQGVLPSPDQVNLASFVLTMGAVYQPRSPALCVAPSGVVHLAWTGFAFGDNNLCLFYRHLSGDVWSETVKIAENPGNPDGVAIALDKSARLHFVWMDDSPGNVDIFHRWGSPVEFDESVRLEPSDARGFTYRGGVWLEAEKP